MTKLFFALDHLKPYAKRLQGQTILTRFGNWLTLHTDNQLAARLTEKQYRRCCLMGLLQDQGVMAGMGNYMCCEALHVTGIHPQHRPADLSTTRHRRLTGSCQHSVGHQR